MTVGGFKIARGAAAAGLLALLSLSWDLAAAGVLGRLDGLPATTVATRLVFDGLSLSFAAVMAVTFAPATFRALHLSKRAPFRRAAAVATVFSLALFAASLTHATLWDADRPVDGFVCAPTGSTLPAGHWVDVGLAVESTLLLSPWTLPLAFAWFNRRGGTGGGGLGSMAAGGLPM